MIRGVKMLNVKFWGKCTKLAKPINPTETLIQLPVGDGARFDLREDDHFYLTLRNGGVKEVVKVVARNGDTLTVERGQENLPSYAFGKGSCACVEWTPTMLCEYVQSCVSGCTNIKPQTFVVQCGTAIEVNACGNIVSINGSEKC